ncbi:hypothetical protein ACFFUA_37925, partial [Streptomyces heliomycini]
MKINGAPINSTAINGTLATGDTGPGYDWEALAPLERQEIYLAEVGGMAVKMTSFQATMRLTGQSFLQIVSPLQGDDALLDALTERINEPMVVKKGYRFEDGSESPMEVIASAPFQLLRSDDGASNHTATLSGYGPSISGESRVRTLRKIQYRSLQNLRRARAEIDL